jgi:hypothetical protein
VGSCVRRNDSESESNARVLTVAWLTLPWGAVASFGVYKVVMWWQGLSISQDYASSMGVLNKIQKSRFLFFVKAVAQDLETHFKSCISLQVLSLWI